MNTKQVDHTKNMLAALLTVAHHAVDLAAASQPLTKADAEPMPAPATSNPLTFGFYVRTLLASCAKVLLITAVEAAIVILFLTMGAAAAAILFGTAAVAGLWLVERLARRQLTTQK